MPPRVERAMMNIRRTPAQVWAEIIKPERWPNWFEGIKSVERDKLNYFRFYHVMDDAEQKWDGILVTTQPGQEIIMRSTSTIDIVIRVRLFPAAFGHCEMMLIVQSEAQSPCYLAHISLLKLKSYMEAPQWLATSDH